VRICIRPKSTLGRWSIGLAIAVITLFVLAQGILGSGPDYDMALAVTLTTILIGIAIAAFVTGLVGIIKSKERSIFVFLTTAIGLYAMIGGSASLLGLA
jgi:hypothetical protein